jgi:valyl-tRNA synthetase
LNKLKNKRYDFNKHENHLFKLWQQEEIYLFRSESINGEKPLFSIDTPPPYTNATWHMGGAIHYSQIDMIARSRRMLGYNVNFPMGLDRNGLPIEIAAEKKFKINLKETSRKEFINYCTKLLDKVGDQILDICKLLGMSCNSFKWGDIYKTDSPEYRALTQRGFIDLWEKGLIYEDSRPNNWDPILGTTIADAEIEYHEGEHSLYEIEFKVLGSDEKYSFATTRPELIPAIKLIIYHPDDQRYRHLEGQKAIIPLWDIEVPILANHFADPEYGTGLVQICSFGDLTDIQILRDLDIEPTYAINLDRRLTKITGKFEGMTIEDGREAIIKELYLLDVINSENIVPYRYPVSERSGGRVEFIGMNEFYLKQIDFIPKLMKYSNLIDFYPEQNRMILKNWLERIKIDWPISRRRYYGTEIPLWYCKNCREATYSKTKRYVQPWNEDPDIDTCPNCGFNEFEGETRIFDTWVDSSISPLYISSHINNMYDKRLETESMNRPFLVDLRPQGKEIVRTWLHYSILRIDQLLNKVAFNSTWISGHVVTSEGIKMSKRNNTNVSPEPMLQKYGADSLRLFGASEASHGSDIRFSEEKLQGNSKFITKLYNIAKFISNFPKVDGKIFYPTDLWFIAELKKLGSEILEGYKAFDFHPAARLIKSFTNDLFSSHYLELVKTRGYNKNEEFSKEEQNSAILTLYLTLDHILKWIAPVTPFITDYIYRELWCESIHLNLFPKLEELDEILLSEDRNDKYTSSNQIIEFNHYIWKMKKENNISLRDEISEVKIPLHLVDFQADLIYMHKIKL